MLRRLKFFFFLTGFNSVVFLIWVAITPGRDVSGFLFPVWVVIASLVGFAVCKIIERTQGTGGGKR